jgi:hypothetical protein
MTTQIDKVLPLYEGKMGNIFDHRSAYFVGIGDTDIKPNPDHGPTTSVVPRYWVGPEVTRARQERRTWGTQTAMLGFRRVAGNTNERTCIAAILPWGAASYGWILSAGPSADGLAFLCAQYNSFAFDYVLRQFLSQPSIPQGTFEQLPCVPRDAFSTNPHLTFDYRWVVEQSVRLSATDEKLATWAAECGVDSAPFKWDPAERARIRTELDAAFFHLFAVDRDDVDYIMDTFNLIRDRDTANHGEFRTKRLVLEAYDQMAH